MHIPSVCVCWCPFVFTLSLQRNHMGENRFTVAQTKKMRLTQMKFKFADQKG